MDPQNGKLVSTPFVLQLGALVYFGRNSTFRCCDPQFVHKTTMKKTNLIQTKTQLNGDKSSMHSSLSSLPRTNIKKSNQIVDPGTMIDVLPGLLEVPAESKT
ncbi:unnamed protein product [Rotaria sp. Silwood2]|nr:unnamed protein product [Rotaria sp. Silwood2]CAF3992950.1 unnamed protein product [Rotaria sp. Silwood2]